MKGALQEANASHNANTYLQGSSGKFDGAAHVMAASAASSHATHDVAVGLPSIRRFEGTEGLAP